MIQTCKQRAYRVLRQQLETGQLVPGDRLTEVALSKRLQVSRGSLREAINQLASEGLVQQTPGLGAQVRSPDLQEICDIYETRQALECFAVEKAAASVSEDTLRRLQEQCDQMAALLERYRAQEDWDATQRQALLDADAKFHELITEASGNVRIAKLLADYRLLQRMLAYHDRVGSASTLFTRSEALSHHLRILEALRQRRPDAGATGNGGARRRSSAERARCVRGAAVQSESVRYVTPAVVRAARGARRDVGSMSTMLEELSGVFVPTLLPLSSSQRLDLESFARHVGYLIAGGVHGLWVNGTSGEFHALTDDEQSQVVQVAAKCSAGRIPVVAHVGDTATRLVIEKARRALAAGATHVSVIPPYYLEYSELELKRHLRLVAQAIRAPLLLYQHPAHWSEPIVDCDPAGSGTGAGCGGPEGQLYRPRVLPRTRAGPRPKPQCRCAAFNGAGATALTTLSQGGHGLISVISNIVPHLCVRLFNEVRAAQPREAAATQEQLVLLGQAFAQSLAQRPNWAPTIAAHKWVLRELGIIESDAVFDPLEPLSMSETDLLRQLALPLAHKICDWALGGADPENGAA